MMLILESSPVTRDGKDENGLNPIANAKNTRSVLSSAGFPPTSVLFGVCEPFFPFDLEISPVDLFQIIGIKRWFLCYFLALPQSLYNTQITIIQKDRAGVTGTGFSSS
ncbi:hypothetical protein HS088_TW06G01264 [Tripterygium wilfordii]|uniref:Uncharacterized protein n=1 Tax=Tripterygium wilfordii TaxID=458696 RepID=A0A7J7DL47_TRIWF|nr:hypothetical protein HS088_TW06G01264 [Tripterygium wilfordii]